MTNYKQLITNSEDFDAEQWEHYDIHKHRGFYWTNDEEYDGPTIFNSPEQIDEAISHTTDTLLPSLLQQAQVESEPEPEEQP